MALKYVRSGAGGAATGADWANAYLTLAAAFAGMSAGDTAYVSEDHAETQASAMTLTSPGTAASPCLVICVNHAGTVPPVSADLRTTATITTTGTNAITHGSQFTFYQGVTISAGSGATTVAHSVAAGTAAWLKFRNCTLKLGGTGNQTFTFGSGAGGPASSVVELDNTALSFGAAGQTVNLGSCKVVWTNTASAVAGTVPTTLFTFLTSAVHDLQCLGVDFSAAGSGKTLFSVGNASHSTAALTDCELGSSVSITTGSIAGQHGVSLRLVNCDSADTNYRYHRQTYQGTVTQETTIVLSGGASDGTTPISRKMTTTANSKFYSPLEGDWMVLWNETTGSALTATIEVVNDGTTLTDADVWVEVEYLGTSGFPQGNFASDRAADILAAGANQTTSSVTWTTTGLASPVKQKLVATFTPVKKGPVRVRVCLAKASSTVYFDPKPAVA